MRLHRLSLRNYRRYRDATIEFPDGVTAILGPNGAGKSTLLEAVGFALYGADAIRTAKDLVRSDGAPPAEAVQAVLELELGGQALTVTRELRGKALTPQASLVVDGATVVAAGAGSNDALTAEMTRRIGLDADAFHTTVVARQGELARLADARPLERKRLVLRLLGIDRVDAAIEQARERRRDAEARLAALRGLPHDPDAVAKLEHAGQEAGRAASDAERRHTELGGAQHALATARAEQAVAEAASAQRARLAQAAADLAAQARIAQAALAQARALVEEARRQALAAAGLEASAQRLAPARAALQDARAAHLARDAWAAQARRAEAMQAEASLLRAALAAPAGSAPDPAPHRAALEAALADAAAAQAEAAAARAEHAAAQERLGSLGHLGAEAPCPTCERPLLDQHGALVARLGTQATAAVARAAAAEARRLAALEATAAARAAMARTEAQARQHALRAAEAARQAARLQELEAALAALPADASAIPPPAAALPPLEAAYEAALQAATRREELLRAASRQGELEAAAQAAQAAAGQAQDAAACAQADPALAAPDPAPAARQAAAAAAAREREAALAHQAAVHRHASLVAVAARLELDVRAQAERAAQERVLEGDHRVWGALAGRGGLLEAFRDHLVARAAPAISAEASRLLAAFTGGRYTEVLVDDEFQLFVTDAGRAYELDRFSGGEQDLVHLAIRLAVSRLLAERSGAVELRLLALDEVFGSLDAGRRGMVVEALRGLGTMYTQVLVMSHLEGLEEALGSAIAVRESGGNALVQNA